MNPKIMKRVVLIVIVCLMLTTITYAGRTISLNALDAENDFVLMQPGDRVEFTYFNKTHTIMLKEIDVEQKQVMLIFWYDSNNTNSVEVPNYIKLAPDVHFRLDFNKDRIPDLKVGLFQISNTSAMIGVGNANFEETPEIIAQPTQKERFNKSWMYAIIFAGIILIIGVIFAKKSRRQKK